LDAVPEGLASGWYFIAQQPASAPYLARPEGRADIGFVLVTVPSVGCGQIDRQVTLFLSGFSLQGLGCILCPCREREGSG